MVSKEVFANYIKRPLREKTVIVDGLEWRLREMSESQGTEYELSLQDKKGNIDFSKARRMMLSLMLVDENGERLSTNEADFSTLPREVAGTLFEHCQKLNSYETGEISDLVGKSETAQG